ncbi:MAG TPA: hypothetical protein PLJ21_12985 [Pseudobdellovibrionaceae bacterium]|nr:hypothetical protein [Pseudobdellovibrionaceae bacterium]
MKTKYFIFFNAILLLALLIQGDFFSFQKEFSKVQRKISSESKPFFVYPQKVYQKKKIVLNPKKMKKFIFPVDRFTTRFDQKDMVQIVPTDINPSSDPHSVIGRIADRGINYWLNSPEMKNAPFVKSTKEMQEKLKTDVVVKGARKNDIDHKFTMSYEAFQALAKVEYKGWFKASVDYKPGEERTQVSIREKILKDKELIFHQSFKKDESSSMIGLGWNW